MIVVIPELAKYILKIFLFYGAFIRLPGTSLKIINHLFRKSSHPDYIRRAICQKRRTETQVVREDAGDVEIKIREDEKMIK